MKRASLSVLGLAIFVTLGSGSPRTTPTEALIEGIPDDLIGLVHEDVEAIPVPDAVTDNPLDPGDSPIRPRWNEEAPPMIPHAIADFMPLTPSDNACHDCHAVEEKIEGEPTPIPPSHYRDLRNAPDTHRDDIAGARYVCTSCHVDQTVAQPLPIPVQDGP